VSQINRGPTPPPQETSPPDDNLRPRPEQLGRESHVGQHVVIRGSRRGIDGSYGVIPLHEVIVVMGVGRGGQGGGSGIVHEIPVALQ